MKKLYYWLEIFPLKKGNVYDVLEINQININHSPNIKYFSILMFLHVNLRDKTPLCGNIIVSLASNFQDHRPNFIFHIFRRNKSSWHFSNLKLVCFHVWVMFCQKKKRRVGKSALNAWLLLLSIMRKRGFLVNGIKSQGYNRL